MGTAVLMSQYAVQYTNLSDGFDEGSSKLPRVRGRVLTLAVVQLLQGIERMTDCHKRRSGGSTFLEVTEEPPIDELNCNFSFSSES